MNQDSFDSFDEMAERTIWPWVDDAPHDMYLWNDEDVDDMPDEDDFYDDSMDGDHDSAMESAGFGTDEDYGYYGDEDY